MVTEKEIADLLQVHGWYLDMVRKYKTRYGYAKRRVGRTVQTRYLATEKKFPTFTEQDILERLR